MSNMLNGENLCFNFHEDPGEDQVLKQIKWTAGL